MLLPRPQDTRWAVGRQSGHGALRTVPAQGGVGKRQGQEPQATRGSRGDRGHRPPLSPPCLCSFPYFDFPRIKEKQHRWYLWPQTSVTHLPLPPPPPLPSHHLPPPPEEAPPAFLDPHLVLHPLPDPVASLPPLGVPVSGWQAHPFRLQTGVWWGSHAGTTWHFSGWPPQGVQGRCCVRELAQLLWLVVEH